MTHEPFDLSKSPLGALGEKMGMRIVEASPERVVATLPVEGNTQPVGLLHGGANAILVETVGSIGAALSWLPTGVAVGLDLNVTHHRSVRTGHVTATATPLTLGRTISCYQVTIVDDEGRLTSTGRLTCMRIDNPYNSTNP